MQGNYNGITTPAAINGAWGKVVNRFQDLNRVDEAYTAANGCTYLFCDTQYVKYSTDIAPANADFYVDESYPKTIAANWSSENTGVPLPSQFGAQGYALLPAPDGEFYIFEANAFTTATDSQPVSIKDVWGKVANNFISLNKVDAAFVHTGKTYLFCGDQYTRYSGDYSGYADEGYPRTIENIGVLDGIEIAAQFPDGIVAIMDGADGNLYVFTEHLVDPVGNKYEDTYVSSADPSTSADVKNKFGIVRNNIADTGIIDAADATKSGVLYLFCGDQYVRYSAGSREFVDESYPKTIANWGNFEGGSLPVTAGVKARFTDLDGVEYYFIKDTAAEVDKFFTVVNGVASGPVLVSEKWGIVKNNLQETGIVDAAFIAPNGKTYLFSGDQYVQYTHDDSTYAAYPNDTNKFAYVDETFPKRIADNWGDLPDGHDPEDPDNINYPNYREGIDAGFVFDGRTYFFKGNTYVRYSDPACKKIDSGFPRPIATGMNDRPDFQLNDVKTYQQLKALSRSFSDTDNTFLSYLEDSRNGLTGDDQRSSLSTVTEWTEDEISNVTGTVFGALSATDIGDIQVLTEMKLLFDIAESMASLPSTLKSEAWDKIYPDQTDLGAAASFLGGQLKAVTGAAAWPGLLAELHNKMNLAKRDGLLGHLIYLMGLGSEDVNWIENARDLYEYLLIDVEMGEDATASRIQEAIMCMQLFYHRLLMSLEDENQAGLTVDKDDLKEWWIWMKNYRVWEANRKVFLYPENYIRPELRLSKSPEFKELEEALLQGDITDENAEDAYKQYLDKFSVISRLKIAGGYAFQRTSDSDDTSQSAGADTEKKIMMFGYSNTEPKKYYYMTGDILEDDSTGEIVQTIDWSPWKEIGITINAEKVYPVYSFNRLFVFWVELRERDQSSYSSSVGPDQKKTQYDPEIYYSFYNIREKWTNPQKMCSLASYIDQLDSTKKELFIDNKDTAKNDPANYIPVIDVLNGARLYVTNPITSRYYDPEEYIYISYQVRYATTSSSPKSYEFTFEGKLKSNLVFEQGQIEADLADKLEKNIEFPAEKFGMTPDSYNHWKGYFNDSFSAPWFSFNAAGGSFLIKPALVQNSPALNSESQTPNQLFGVDWTNFPDAGFTDKSNRKHLFYREDLTGSTQYYRVKNGDTLSNPVPVTDEWGKRNIFVWYPEGVESAAVNGDKTFIATAGGRAMSYTGSDLTFIDQASADDTLSSLDDQVLPSGAATEWHRVKEDLGDFLDTLENAFVYSGDNKLYLVANPVNELGVAVREYTIPNVTQFWQELAALAPEVAGTIGNWTSALSAKFYNETGNKKLYITSGDDTAGYFVFVKDYIAGTNSVIPLNELPPDLLPEVTAKVSSLTGLLPAEPAVSWSDVAEDFSEYVKTVQRAFVWNGDLYLVAPQYTKIEPAQAPSFWSAVAENMPAEVRPAVSGYTAVDSACIVTESGASRLYVTFNANVAICDIASGAWTLSSVNAAWNNIGFTKIDGLIQAPEGKVYIFSGRNYAEAVNGVYTSYPVTSKWGSLTNVITGGIVEAAFMDGEGRAYLFTSEKYMRYSDLDSKVMDLDYPKEVVDNFGIDPEDVKEEFSSDPSNIVEITNIGINTAFTQNVEKREILRDADGNPVLDAAGDVVVSETEEEKTYLFMDVTADITTRVWRWRWKWWGNWTTKTWWGISYWRRSWWGWWWPEFYLDEKTETVRKSVYARFSRSGEQYQMDVDYPKVITGNWTNLTGDFNKMITCTFEDVEVNADSGVAEDVFYAVRTLLQEDDSVINDYIKYTGKENFPKEISEEIYQIIRLTSNTSEVLSQKLFIDGIDGLLTLDMQRSEELPKFEVRTDDERTSR